MGNLQNIKMLVIYTNENSANSKYYVALSVGIVQKFLSDIQLREYDIAPIKNVRILIFPGDKPKVPKKSVEQIDYVPNFVLEQLFDNINNLN